MGFFSGKHPYSVKPSQRVLRLKNEFVKTASVSKARTLVDVLEPRLLFSAEHPLGLGITATATDSLEAQQLRDDAVALSSALDLLTSRSELADVVIDDSGKQRLSAAEISDEEEHLPVDVLLATHSTSVQIDNVILADGFDSAMLADSDDGLKIIYVTTTIDQVDATDLSSFENFASGEGGDGNVSLREAILVANTDSEVDIISIPNGTYNLVLGASTDSNEDEGSTGDLDIKNSYILQGEDETNTIISQTVGNHRVLDLHTGNVTVQDVTIKDGSVVDDGRGAGAYVHGDADIVFEDVSFISNNPSLGQESDLNSNSNLTPPDIVLRKAFGGAIYVEGDDATESIDLTLIDVTIVGSEASEGGAIYAGADSRIEIVNSDFRENRAEAGAGLYTDPSAVVAIEKSDLSNNAAVDGGGIFNSGELLIEDSEVHNNTATNQGGGLFNDGMVNLVDSDFYKNTARKDGGAIYNAGDLELNNSALIENYAGHRGAGLHNTKNASLIYATIWGNEAHTKFNDEYPYTYGGGIYSDTVGLYSMTQSIVANNKSENFSAGISLAGNATISDSVIVDNVGESGVGSGAGIGGYVGNFTGTGTIRNTIVANNTQNGSASDVESISGNNIQSEGYNFVGYGYEFVSDDTDILGDTLTNFSVSLHNNRAQINIDSEVSESGIITSATVNSGDTRSSGTVSLDGGTIGSTPNIGGYTLDIDSGLAFWSGIESNGTAAIYRSDTNFTYAQKIVGQINAPLDIEIDSVNERVYWLESVTQSIRSAKFDGSELSDGFAVDYEASSIALDIPNKAAYATTKEGGNSVIVRYKQSDSEANGFSRDVIQNLGGNADSIALDLAANKLYWSESTGNNTASLFSLSLKENGDLLDSATPQAIAVDSEFTKAPYAIDVIDSNGVVFWSDPDLDHVAAIDHNEQSEGYLKSDYVKDPRALVYDGVNNRIVFVSDNAQVVSLNNSLGSITPLGVMDVAVTHLDMVTISADEIPLSGDTVSDSDEQASPTIVNNGLNISEGEAGKKILTADLQVFDESIDSSEFEYTLLNEAVEIEIYNLSFDVTKSSFTQRDIDEGRISVNHSGIQSSIEDSWTIPLRFSIEDADGFSDEITLLVTVNSVDDKPQLVIGEDLSFENGALVPVSLELLDAVDEDTAFKDLIFTVPTTNENEQIVGNFQIDGSVVNEFSKQDIQDGLVRFQVAENNETGASSIAGLTVKDDTNTSSEASLEFTITPAAQDPSFLSPVSFNVDENDEYMLDSDFFSIEDSDSSPGQIQFNVAEIKGGELWIDNSDVDYFTLADLNTFGHVIFKHTAVEPTEDAYVTLSVKDEQSDDIRLDINITVNGVNDNAAVAQNHIAVGKNGFPVTRIDDSSGGLQNSLLYGLTDEDVGSTSTYKTMLEQDAGFGSVQVNEDGTFVYTPSSENDRTESYSDAFLYKIYDDDGLESNIASVTIDVQGLKVPTIVTSIAAEELKDVTATENSPFEFVFSEFLFQSNENIGPLVFNVEYSDIQGFSSLVFDTETRMLSGTPSGSHTGMVEVKLSVFEWLNETQALQSAEYSFEIAIADVNQNPVIDGINVYPILENVEGSIKLNGEREGRLAVLSASDPDGDAPLQYSVEDNRFVFIDNTLWLAEGMSLNHETDDNIEVTLEVSDGYGGTASVSRSIIVTDVSEWPTISLLPLYTASENNQSIDLGLLEILDEDKADELTISFSDPRFRLENSRLLFNSQDVLNYEENALVPLTVTVKDSVENSVYETIIVNVGDVNDLPSIAENTVYSIEETNGYASEVSLGELIFSDEDGDSVDIAVDDQRFDVVDNKLVFISGSSLDYEVEEKINLDVIADDGSGEIVTAVVIVDVLNVNEAPEIELQSTYSVAENTDKRVLAALFTVTDQDNNLVNVSVDDDRFRVDNGSIFLKNNTLLNFEEESVIDLVITATDAMGKASGKQLAINVIDVNDPPILEVASNYSLFENQNEDILGEVTSEDYDRDPADTLTYEVNDYRFVIVDGFLKVFSVDDFDFENDTSVEIEISVNDGNGGIASKNTKVFLFSDDEEEVEELPQLSVLKKYEVLENSAGAIIGQLGFVDGDANKEYQLYTDNSIFTISNGFLKLSAEYVADYEAQSVYTVKISIENEEGDSVSQYIDIHVIDANDSPVSSKMFEEQVLDANSRIVIGSDWFIDQDGHSLSFSLSLAEGRPLPDWISFDSIKNEITLGVLPDRSEEVVVWLTADDDNGGEATVSYVIRYDQDYEQENEPELLRAAPVDYEYDSGLESAVSTEIVQYESFLRIDSDQEDTDYAKERNGDSGKNNSNKVVVASVGGISELVRLYQFGFLTDEENRDTNSVIVRNKVLSEYFKGDAVDKRESSFRPREVTENGYNSLLSLVELFTNVNEMDVKFYDDLSDSFTGIRSEIESRESESKDFASAGFTASTGLSLGYLLYSLRSGVLMSSMLSSFPAWRFVDPLPIVNFVDAASESDQVSLQSMVSKSNNG